MEIQEEGDFASEFGNLDRIFRRMNLCLVLPRDLYFKLQFWDYVEPVAMYFITVVRGGWVCRHISVS